MKKVLIIANEWTTIVHFRMEILQGLIKARMQVVVALPVCDEAKHITDMGCELVNINVSRHGTNPVRELKLLKECKAVIKQHKPDIVITYTVKPNIYGGIACQMLKIPYLSNVTGVGTVLQSKSVVARLMLLLMRKGFKKSSCVFFQNQDNYQRFLDEKVINDNTPVAFLPGSGVNLEKFSYVPYPKCDINRFVIVSRVRHDKGYAEFFDAAEIVKAKHSDCEFHVVGWYEDEDLRQRVDELKEQGTIIYHGSLSQEEVHNVVSQCSCLVHPSYHEGMANVILEAAATGRPVIATNICGCKEAVEDGITGFLCEVKNSASLAEQMEKFIGLSPEQQESMGNAGRMKMEREFDRKKVANILLSKIHEAG